MLQQESRLRISDNSGGRRAKLIRFKKLGKSIEALIRVTLVFPSKKIKKGEIHFAVVISLCKPLTRLTGVTVNSYFNDILILKKDKTPLANRVYRPVFLELRYSSLSRVISIARSIY